MAPALRLVPAGDRCLVVECGDGIDASVNDVVHRLSRAIDDAGLPGVTESVPTYRSLAVHIDPLLTSVDVLRPAIAALAERCAAAVPLAPEGRSGRLVEIPVVYGGVYGPDIEEVARHCGLSPGEIVARHAAVAYRVYMMGFTPGFPYLGGMDSSLATPRLSSPRTSVPAGSVGIAAEQTGIYPISSPGGWRLIGRTPLRLFDPSDDPPSLIDAGDTVRFVPISEWPGAEIERQPAATPTHPAASAVLTMLDAGALTTVQDLGRFGYQRFGVPVTGAMDTDALRAANRLVDNAAGDAALEMTVTGPTVRCERDGMWGLTGADMGASLNGRPVPRWQSFVVRAGDILTMGAARDGIRGYLAVAGGLDVPLVLRSRSTCLAGGFGGVDGRALRPGDQLGTVQSRPMAPRRSLVARRLPAAAALDVRVVLGPQDEAFTPEGLETFLNGIYAVTPRSDRVGCRLDGPRITHRHGADIISDATACGSVQVTGDGQPIVLMTDRGTTGGYTKIATVISADLSLMAQAGPGTRVRFIAVSLDVALDARREADRWLDAVEMMAPAVDAVDAGVFDEDAGSAWAADAAMALADAISVSVDPRAGAPGVIRAPMAGQVIDVAVAAGASIAERDTLLTIEAMKMQNPLRAPRAGLVARVCVAPGDTIAAGTIVVELED
jgi:KipI family sensor histidine kinase inhibitor